MRSGVSLSSKIVLSLLSLLLWTSDYHAVDAQTNDNKQKSERRLMHEKFTIKSLDDPRLKNPWAPLPGVWSKNTTTTTAVKSTTR
jgi:hypothetical protein